MTIAPFVLRRNHPSEFHNLHFGQIGGLFAVLGAPWHLQLNSFQNNRFYSETYSMKKYSILQQSRTLLLACLLSCNLCQLSLSAEFIPLGFLGSDADGEFRSAATDISADGLVVAGRTTGPLWADPNSGDQEGPFRWTRETGMTSVSTENLRFSVPRTESRPVLSSDGPAMHWLNEASDSFFWSPTTGTVADVGGSLSADGSVAVGTRSIPGDSSQTRIQLWTADEGFTLVPPPNGFDRTQLGTVSSDGTKIVGQTDALAASGDGNIILWSAEKGSRLLPNGHLGNNSPRGLSSDGTVAFGTFERSTGRNSAERGIWRWSEDGGTEILASGLVGFDANNEPIIDELDFTSIWQEPQSPPGAISDDGSIFVGVSAPGRRPVTPNSVFRWTEERGFALLPHFPDYVASSVIEMTPDGKWLLGQSTRPISSDDPFKVDWLWSEATGMLNLLDVFESQGLGPEIEGWSIMDFLPRMSSDASAISGFGTNPEGRYEAWVAYLDPLVIPEPGTLALSLVAVAGLAIRRQRVL